MARLFLARLMKPFRWRNPRSTARMLLDFAKAERSSFYDMMEAANATGDLKRKAQYVSHAVDEARHAKMFTLRALELDPSRAADPSLFHADFEHLFTRLGEAKFISFVHLGEKRGRTQMAMFRDELQALEGTKRADTRTKALLDAVMRDEMSHESYSLVLSKELGGSLVGARAWELKRGWLRAGALITGLIYTLLMSVLYLLLFPLALLEKMKAKGAG
ncbi:MAG: ferritin-like domain-containing protein [Archangium sp.]|nr:ferritin-like domain-containing protein [Archangium sp.]